MDELGYSVAPPPQKEAGRLVSHHKPALNPQPSIERMKIMARYVSATQREETPHTINSTTTKTLNLNGAAGNIVSNALKRRAQSLTNNTSIDPTTRTIIRYALEIRDVSLPKLV